MIDALHFTFIFALGAACGWGATLCAIKEGFFDDIDKMGPA